MIRKLSALAAAAALCVEATASAQGSRQGPAMAGPSPSQETGYLPASALDGKVILPPPPAVDSPYGRADRATYDDTRALKDSPRWREAIQDNDLSGGGAIKRFSCVIGVDISEKQTPTAWKLLHKIQVDVRTFSTPAKDFYARPRPALGNDKPVCVPRQAWMATNASYPSGHATTAWAWALILTEVLPAKADEILKLGRESGESRVVCGVHFPSDVEAGRTLSAGMVARLHADPAFAADLAALKRELAAASEAPKACAA
jgi:acid phosphatase (class A)